MKPRTLIILLLIALVAAGLLLPEAKQPAPELSRTAEKQLTAASKVKSTAAHADYFTSAAGIDYGRDWSGKFETRVAHIMAHTQADNTKLKHSVFLEKTREGVLALLDEAWKKRGPPKRDGGTRGRDVYDVPMDRVIGTAGEQRLRIVMEPDSATIVTAYPTP